MASELIWGKPFVGGDLINIKAVKNGLACNCLCPKCGDRLIAKQGNVRTAHFAHEGDRKCDWAPESALHQLAKEIIAEHNSIRLSDGTRFLYNQAKREHPIANMIADVFVENASASLIIEIFVTHEITPIKEQIIKNSGYRALEIDLSEVDRNITKHELTELLINKTENKRNIQEPRIIAENENGWNGWSLLALLGLLIFIFWASVTYITGRQKGYRRAW